MKLHRPRVLITAKLAGLALLMVFFPAWAHEFWLTLTPTANGGLELRAWVGENFSGEPRMFYRDKTLRLEQLAPSGRRAPLYPTAADSTAAVLVQLSEAGTHAVVFEGSPKRIVLDSAKFHSYLREDGMEHIIAERAQRGELAAPGRELYSRHCMVLIHRGATPPAPTLPATWLQGPNAALDLQLVPDVNPLSLRPGQSLTGVLQFRGRPCAGAKVVAWQRRGETAHRIVARTDASGRVSLTLDQPGSWMVSVVHMARLSPTEAARDQADWRSYWGNLTFAIAAQ